MLMFQAGADRPARRRTRRRRRRLLADQSLSAGPAGAARPPGSSALLAGPVPLGRPGPPLHLAGRGPEAGVEPPPSPHGGGGRLLHWPGHADVHLLLLLPPLLLHHLPRHLPPPLPALPGGGAPGGLGPGLPHLQPPGHDALLVWSRHCPPYPLPGQTTVQASFCQIYPWKIWFYYSVRNIICW